MKFTLIYNMKVKYSILNDDIYNFNKDWHYNRYYYYYYSSYYVK